MFWEVEVRLRKSRAVFGCCSSWRLPLRSISSACFLVIAKSLSHRFSSSNNNSLRQESRCRSPHPEHDEHATEDTEGGGDSHDSLCRPSMLE